jgi:hypothetical protein
VAELRLKRLKKAQQDYTRQMGREPLSPNFCNKIGKMEIRPTDFESSASASSAIAAPSWKCLIFQPISPAMSLSRKTTIVKLCK